MSSGIYLSHSSSKTLMNEAENLKGIQALNFAYSPKCFMISIRVL